MIYILTYDDFGDFLILGAYSSLELLEKEIKYLSEERLWSKKKFGYEKVELITGEQK